MSSTSSVDGLVSGLDTTALISQLMSIEKQPQQILQQQQSTVNNQLNVYRNLNSKFSAVETAAADLASAATWNSTKSSTSNSAVATVTATSSAVKSSLSFEVTKLAATHTLVSANTVADRDTTVVATGGFTLGSTQITDVGNGTLNDVANAINTSSAGVRATIVQTGNSEYRLQLSAKNSGAAAQFTVTGSGLAGWGGFNTITTGADATLKVGEGSDPGQFYTITSSSNTFTNVLNGVTINAQSLGKATINTDPDPDSIATKVQALVDAVNGAAGYVRDNSTFDATTKTAGTLLGDYGASQLGQSLLTAISTASQGSLTAGSVGLSTDSTGKLSFDKTKFLAAYNSNPTAVGSMFQANGAGTSDDGIAEKLRVIADKATDSGIGQITNAIDSRTAKAKTLTDQISAWDTRLADKEASLKKYFSDMETALGKLKDQSSWLSGQLASLSSG